MSFRIHRRLNLESIQPGIGMQCRFDLVSLETIDMEISDEKRNLKVRCELDENIYPAGIKVSDEDMAKLNIIRDDFHGEWNYSIIPRQLEITL